MLTLPREEKLLQNSMIYNYDNLDLPESVNNILQQDFWVLESVNDAVLRAVSDPVKFSATSSIFIRRGECRAEISLAEHHIVAPAVVNIRTDQILTPIFISKDFDASCIIMSPRFHEKLYHCISDIPAYMAATRHQVVAVDPQYVRDYNELYSQLCRIAADAESPYALRAAIFQIASFFSSVGWKAYSPYADEMPSPQSRIAEQFFNLLQHHYRKERFLEFYAARLDITPKHLSRTLRRHTGFSATDWIERYVILEAKVLLRGSNLNIQQIAEELNFPSQSVFGKYFKSRTGLSPKDFRNHH